MNFPKMISIVSFYTLVKIVYGDISHLDQYYHHYYPQGLLNQFNQLYESPYFAIAPTTTTSPPPIFQLPEIIVNRKAPDNGNGYHYPKPINTYIPVTSGSNGHYIPPPQSSSPAPPSQFIPELPEQNFPEQPIQPVPPLDQTLPPPVPSPPSEGDLPSQGYLPPSSATGPQPIEIIINQDSIVTDGDGYNYQPPLDIPSTSTFSPFGPGSDNPIEPPSPSSPPTDGYNYQSSPPIAYLPPTPDNRSLKDFHSIKRIKPIQLRLNEMRCLSSSENGYFRAILTPETHLKNIPIIDQDSSSTKATDNHDHHCDIRLIKSKLIIDIHSENFQKCHVKNCGNNNGANNNGADNEQNLCLRIRFPIISGMKTASDSILTLQCKLQEKVVTRTHSLKIGISNELQARSLGTYAQGGSQQPFKTHLELFRKSGSSGFTRTLEPHGIVQLGEELLLRAHVRPGDGWNHTRLSDVTLQRISSKTGELLNSATLITSLGCINPLMRFICPLPPILESPLTHRLTFKAIMFDGMKNGDEIVLSVKISGCIEQRDCHINSFLCNQNSNQNLNWHHRKIRSITNKRNETMTMMANKSTENYSEISRISFRVQIPSKLLQNNDATTDANDEGEPQIKSHTDFEIRSASATEAFDLTNTKSIVGHFIIGSILGFIFLMSLIAMIIYYKFK